MTAGTGVAHSEFNASEEKPAKLLQMWVLPERPGLTPSYEQKQFTIEDRRAKLLPIASGQEMSGAVKVHQDVTFYVSSLKSSEQVTHDTGEERLVFVYVIEGDVTINGQQFNAGDQARISDTRHLEISSLQDSEIILIDLPPVKIQ